MSSITPLAERIRELGVDFDPDSDLDFLSFKEEMEEIKIIKGLMEERQLMESKPKRNTGILLPGSGKKNKDKEKEVVKFPIIF